MHPLELTFLWSAYFLYITGMLTFTAGLLSSKELPRKLSNYIFLVAFTAQTVSIAVRWILSGHPPVMVPIEHAQSGTWFLAAVFLSIGLKYKRMRSMQIPVSVVILVMLSFGIAAGLESVPLAPQFRSPWLWFHVSFAWLSWGAYVIASGSGLYYILMSRTPELRVWRLFPEHEKTTVMIFRLIFFGFIAQGLMIMTGAIWGHSLWGSYWSWDPMETWSLISWIIYGLFLHLYLTMGWRGRKAAWYAFLALITNIIYYWGMGLMESTHTRLM